MLRISTVGLIVFTLSLLLHTAAMAAGRTFYIDFDKGSDDADGLTPATAFKHAPGDPQAAGKPKELKLAGGDMVLFKGGVFYRGTIVAQSGAEGAPLVYDGNSAGKFGQGKAIIDGSEPISGWKRCASADEAAGNPNWKNIFYATLKLPKAAEADADDAADKKEPDYGLTINLVQNDKQLQLSRDPNPTDPFFLDELETMRITPDPLPVTKEGKETIYTDPALFTQKGAHDWDGAYLEAWLKPNFVHFQKVLSYDPAAHAIHTEPFKTAQYPSGRGKSAMVNHVRLIDRAGEYALAPVDGDSHRIYVWPLETGNDGPTGTITYSIRANGFILGGQSHVTIQNFVIQKQSGAIGQAIVIRSKSADIQIRNNEVRFLNSVNRGGAIGFSTTKQLVIDGNHVHHNRIVRGIAGGGEDVAVTNNQLEKNGGTGIGFFGVTHGRIAGNTVSDHAGVHANGLTVYLNSSDVIVENNHVFDSNVCLTLQDSEKLIIRNNVLDRGVAGHAIALWTGTHKDIQILNNLLLRSEGGPDYQAGIFTNSKDIKGLVVRNNIIDGVSGPVTGTFDHNLYLRWGDNQKDKKLGDGEIFESDLNKIFVDPAKRDYHLKPGSPAIGKGADVDVEKDFGGAARPKGKIDIGPYQH